MRANLLIVLLFFGVWRQTSLPVHPLSPQRAVGIFINGTHVVDQRGNVFHLQGAVWSLMEYSCADRGLFTVAEFATMKATWHMNTVKLPVNPHFWVGSQACPAAYKAEIEQSIANAETAGLDVMLSLYAYNFGGSGDRMPDWRSVATWADLATHYKGDSRVIYEAFAEPHDVSNAVWRDGAPSLGYVGMQTLLSDLQADAPGRPVFVNTPNWGGVPGLTVSTGYGLKGSGFGYTAHIYDAATNSNQANWPTSFGNLARSYPVIAAEYGDQQTCSGAWLKQLLPYLRAHISGWMAWTWDNSVNDCGRPAIITDWAGDASAYGAPIQAYYLSDGI